MQFLTAVLALVTIVSPTLGAPVQSPIMGSISAPTSNSTLHAQTTFPFSYSVVNWCEEGYNNFKVFLTEKAPTFKDVDASGNIPNVLVSFGQFTVANFGLPQTGTPPPVSLTMPSTTTTPPSSVFITVVETFSSCPGNVAQEVGVTSIPMKMQ